MVSDLVLHVTAATISLVVILLVIGKSLKFETGGIGGLKSLVAFIAGILVALGFYFFPFGALEAYDGTQSAFGWTDSMNAVFWYVATTLAIVLGILGLRWVAARRHT